MYTTTSMHPNCSQTKDNGRDNEQGGGGGHRAWDASDMSWAPNMFFSPIFYIFTNDYLQIDYGTHDLHLPPSLYTTTYQHLPTVPRSTKKRAQEMHLLGQRLETCL